MINSAGEYRHSVNASKIPLFFGFSTSKRTLLRSLSTICPVKEIMVRKIRMLTQIHFVVGIFDNSQIITEMKFQRGGKLSHVTLVTARMFVKTLHPKWLYFVKFSREFPEIIYLGQVIPRPYGMPVFESIEKIDASHFSDEKWITNSPSMDVSRSRVDVYYKLLCISHMVGQFLPLLPFWVDQFQFSNREHNTTLKSLSIIWRFKRLSDRRGEGGLFWRIRKFQRSVTCTWRNNGFIPPASALIPPVNPADETTNVGAAQNVVSLLLLSLG